MSLQTVRKKIFIPLQVLRSRSPLLKYLNKLEKTQYYSTERLKEIQWQRFKKLWAFLWENNTFYRNRFKKANINFHSLQSLEDMQKIPILTKDHIRENVRYMISDGYKKNNLFKFKTGGSTGKSLELYLTENCSEFRNACAIRHNRWAGWEPGEPIAAVWGNPKIPATFKDRIKNKLIQPFIYLDTMSVDQKSVDKFIYEWKRVKPKLLFGHAHSLFILSQYIDSMKNNDIRPDGIISTSMMLIPHERIFIEKVFKKKVTDRYGCEEVSLIGSECEKHEGLHMNIEHLVIEFIREDGSLAGPGEPSQIIVTDLMNYAMPFVRYRVEDIGAYLERKCTCGRGLPLMDKVTGRVADFLVKKDGVKVSGISLIENTLTKMCGIKQMQIVQDEIYQITLNIVPGIEYSEKVKDELQKYFKSIFPGVNITINIVEDILPLKSGKYRFSICNI